MPLVSLMKERCVIVMMLYYIIDSGLWFQTWECGIRLCKELSTLYEEELFDYHKLSAILVSSYCIWSMAVLLIY